MMSIVLIPLASLAVEIIISNISPYSKSSAAAKEKQQRVLSDDPHTRVYVLIDKD